jgi:hypothetical protein
MLSYLFGLGTTNTIGNTSYSCSAHHVDAFACASGGTYCRGKDSSSGNSSSSSNNVGGNSNINTYGGTLLENTVVVTIKTHVKYVEIARSINNSNNINT